jgi:hypothetical protein
MGWLADDWRSILRYAWSLRLIALATLLSAIEFALPMFMADPPVHRGVFAALAFVVSIAAAIARLVAQRSVRS